MTPTDFFKNTEIAGLLLVVISSALLGIWATMDTIALRNILLWIGSLVCIFYYRHWYQANKSTQRFFGFPLFSLCPLLLVILMFVWVLAHYLFFSQNSEQQLNELLSTWLRAFLAVNVGLATGMAINQNKRLMPFLWLGLMISFLILIYQYIPKALENQSLFAIDWFGDYIYFAKFNGVLAGTILISGLLGLLIDRSAIKKDETKNIKSKLLIFSILDKYTIFNFLGVRTRFLFYILLGVCLVIYSFVFVFDAKAGVGMALILIFLGLGLWFVNFVFNKNIEVKKVFYIKLLTAIPVIALTLFWFATTHMKNNPGWDSIFEDIAMGAQIDKYQNWKAPGVFGPPLREGGDAVQGTTYLRVAWARAGLRIIRENPYGIGVFRLFHEQVINHAPNMKDYVVYTHSAWIDIGLAFGIPGLVIIPGALIALLLIAATSSQIPYRATVFSLTIAILTLYLVGEYGFQHGIEILFYLCGLLSGLVLISSARLRVAMPKS